MTILDDKRRLRAEAKAARAAARAAAQDAPARLAERFLAEIKPSPGIVAAAYWPIGDEFDVRPLLDALHAAGVLLALPVVIAPGQALSFRAWAPGNPLVEGPYRIPSPLPSAMSVTPRLLIVPLLAFDREGWRLGYGAGYYDRTLEVLGASAKAIGVAYAAQEVPSVPHDAGDRPLDAVVTEAGVHRFTETERR